MSDADDNVRFHVDRWRSMSPGRPPDAPSPGPGQESVWDYPRPPRIERVEDSLRVVHRGMTIASTTHGLRVCETASPPTYYFPARDVFPRLLQKSATTSYCEWKGRATYWALPGKRGLGRDVAWSYEEPLAAFGALRGHFAFYAAAVDACYVGDERVRAQTGGFYGGWITSRILGPFKGSTGTGHW